MSILHVLIDVLLYAAVAGLSMMWLLLLAKLLKEGRTSSPKRRRKGIELLSVLAVFDSGLAVMVFTHGRGSTVAYLLMTLSYLMSFFIIRGKIPHN